MRRLLLFVALGWLAPCGQALAAPGLTVTLHVDRPVFRADEPVLIRMCIANTGREPVAAADFSQPGMLEFILDCVAHPQVFDSDGRRLPYRGPITCFLLLKPPFRVYAPGERLENTADVTPWFDWRAGSGLYGLTFPPFNFRSPAISHRGFPFVPFHVPDTVYFAVARQGAGAADLEALRARVAGAQTEVQFGEIRTRTARSPVSIQDDVLVPASALRDVERLRLFERDGKAFATYSDREIPLTLERFGDGEALISTRLLSELHLPGIGEVTRRVVEDHPPPR